MGENELLIYGLLFIGYLIFNYVAQMAARRAEEQRQAQEAMKPQEQDLPREVEEPLEVLWGRQQEREALADSGPAQPKFNDAPEPAPAPAPGPDRARYGRLFRSHQDLRHAVVVMTVLGPCRALQPYDRD